MSQPLPEREQPVEFVAVRHGLSLANVAFSGGAAAEAELLALNCRDADVPLVDSGLEQAAELGAWLAGQPPFEAVYCSPYVRTRITLDIVLAELPAGRRPPVLFDERLRDRELGQLELLSFPERARRFPGELARRKKLGDLYYRPPGGESLADVALRVRSVLRDIPRTRRTLLVGHDVVVLMLRYITEGMSEAELRETPSVANASISRWAVVPESPESPVSAAGLRLLAYNETSHLKQRERD